jgi:precorrin-6B C5,15-methyltransferase / cobalt-precorrin-6B C5,C15-methyltransferase
MDSQLAVIGIGADGLDGLNPHARQEILDAEVVLGGVRHLDLLPEVAGQERVGWPSPLRSQLLALLDRYAGRRLVVLASGDPLVSGIGSTLVDLLGAERVRITPAISSVALARARMGWPAETVEVVSLVGRDPRALLRTLTPDRRVLVLSSGGHTPAQVAELLVSVGFGDSDLSVFGDLGAPDESRVDATAADWHDDAPALNVVAIRCRGAGLPVVPGLPDDAFEHDGQLTRRDLRAPALARLAPLPGQLLWDIGAGAGSVGIEWLRTHPSMRAVAVEAREDRAERITRNAQQLGVPGLQVVTGSAPEALDGLPAPDAIFVGGGASRDGVLDAALAALAPGGRLVVHGVTLQTESLLAARHAELGGELIRIRVETAAPVGGFTGWTPGRAITQWALVLGEGER